MGLTKLDRATTAKIQQVSGSPTSSTRGNIAVASSGPTLYFKYGSLWYSSSASSGVFESDTGTLSAKRVGNPSLHATGNYSFIMGSSGTVSGSNSAAFGGSQSIASDYSFAAGVNNSIVSGAHYSTAFGQTNTIGSNSTCSFVSGYSISIGDSATYNTAFGYDHTINTSSHYNITGGQQNTINGMWNSIFGYYNNCYDANNFYNFIGGAHLSLTSASYCFATGRDNSIQYSYNATFGYNNENKEYYSMVYGSETKAIWMGARHFSGVTLDGGTKGSSMGLDGLILTAQTSGASSVDLTFDSTDGSGTNPLYCPDGQTIIVGVRIVGIFSSGTNGGMEIYDFNLVIERQDPSSFNVTAFGFDGSGSPTTPIKTYAALYDIGSIGIVEDAGNYKAIIRATGRSGIVTNWTAHLYKGITLQGSYFYGGS